MGEPNKGRGGAKRSAGNADAAGNGKPKQGPAEEPRGEEKAPAKRGRSKKRNKAELVGKVIETIEAKLEGDQIKPTVGDFIRLLQLEKELEEEQPREIKVSWVEPEEKDGEGNVSEK